MATGMFGANPDLLREVGGDFHRSGDLVERAGFDLRGEIDGVDWFGPDADAYRANWGDRLHQDFRDLAGTLRDYRGELERQADAQDDASEAGGKEGCLESTWNGIVDFGGGLLSGIWGDITGVAGLLGFDENWNWSWDNVVDTWTGMGVLVGYNPADGTWGNWGLAGDAWKTLGKEIVAWDTWGQNNGEAAGMSVWNIGSTFIPFGALGKAGKLGKLGLLDEVGSVAGKVDDVGTVAGKVDDVGSVASKADEAGSVAGKTDDAGSVAGKTDEAGGASRWNTDGSPDVPGTTRVDGADANKMRLHDGPYDTGATIDPVTGDLVSTSGRTYTPEQVSHHYTTSTGAADPTLRVSDTAPYFEPNHRYVLDDGKTVIETDELGRPDYTRYTMDGRGERPNGSFSSDPWRGGTQTSAKNWPDELYHANDQRGHGSPAQHRGPNEDLNTAPQSPSANSAQAVVENAISESYYGQSNPQPYIVERGVTYDGPGHASRYEFTVTDSHGNPVSLRDSKGNPVPMGFDD